MNTVIRPRQLFVTGGSRLSANAALLWRELGRLLGAEDSLVVITGGLQQFVTDPTAVPADRMIVEGMLETLRARGVAPELHIETVLPDVQHDWNELIRFKEGKIRTLENRNAQSRRFSMVYSADVVISVEGEHGTRSVLDVALAINRPILPLPFGGRVSKDVWKSQREDIIKWFRIESHEADEFEQLDLPQLNAAEIRELARRVHAIVMRGFTQGCFVIMRFHHSMEPVFKDAIAPALATYRLEAWRTDRSVAAGDVVEAIRDGVNHCYFAIADTTDDRPNVMYELGLAHALNKPVILLRRMNPDGSLPVPPFDFQTQMILGYDDDLDDLRRRLETAIGVLTGRIGLPLTS